MIAFSFIAGLVSGASLGIIFLCLLIAGKKNDAISYIYLMAQTASSGNSNQVDSSKSL